VEKLTNEQVGCTIIANTLGHSIDMHIGAGDIADPKLSALWAEAETYMNAIQLYLEEQLGEEFFNV